MNKPILFRFTVTLYVYTDVADLALYLTKNASSSLIAQELKSTDASSKSMAIQDA